ncbi:fungal hydrophobin-domain-containing protein [Cyathus striatus]|nr:fungal hydrophobin-domain-containing protein [Cyathus striatus]
MQFKSAAFATLSLATFAAATGSDQCTTGSLQCCQSTGTASSSSIASLLAIVGVAVQDVTGLVGVTCSAISGVGVGGDSCTAQPVCCTNNSFNGVIALGCSPINIGA